MAGKHTRICRFWVYHGVLIIVPPPVCTRNVHRARQRCPPAATAPFIVLAHTVRKKRNNEKNAQHAEGTRALPHYMAHSGRAGRTPARKGARHRGKLSEADRHAGRQAVRARSSHVLLHYFADGLHRSRRDDDELLPAHPVVGAWGSLAGDGRAPQQAPNADRRVYDALVRVSVGAGDVQQHPLLVPHAISLSLPQQHLRRRTSDRETY